METCAEHPSFRKTLSKTNMYMQSWKSWRGRNHSFQPKRFTHCDRANILFRATKAADFKNGSPRKLLSQRFFWESFSNNSAKKHSKFEHFFSQSSQKQIQIQECISRSASFCLAARLVLQSRLVSSGMDELLPFTASIAKISGIVVFFAFVVRSLRRIFCLGKKCKPQNILKESVPLVKNGSMEELDSYLRTRRFSEPTFRRSGNTNH